MTKFSAILALLILGGCSSAPKPVSCEGTFRPVNAPEMGSQHLSTQASLDLCKGGRHA